MKFYFSTILWGDYFIDIFCNITLKSLLTRENINKSNINENSIFVIACLKKDKETIEDSEAYKCLVNQIEVKFIEIDIFTKKIKSENNKYKIINSIQEVLIFDGKMNCYDNFFYIYPDSIYSKSAVKSLKKKIEEGFKLIFTPGPLVNIEGIDLSMNIFDKTKGNYCGFSKSYISKLVLNKLHPYYRTLDLKVQKKIAINSGVILDHDPNFLIIAGFNLHPAVFTFDRINISKINIDASFDESIFDFFDYSIDETYNLQNSQELIICTVESNYTERARISIQTLDYVNEHHQHLNSITQHLTNFAEKNTNIHQRISLLNTFVVYENVGNVTSKYYKDKLQYFEKLTGNVFANLMIPDLTLKASNKAQYNLRKNRENREIINDKKNKYIIDQNKIIENNKYKILLTKTLSKEYKSLLIFILSIKIILKKAIFNLGMINADSIEKDRKKMSLLTKKINLTKISLKSVIKIREMPNERINSDLKELTFKEKITFIQLSIAPDRLIRFLNHRIKVTKLNNIKRKNLKVIQMYKVYGKRKIKNIILSVFK